MRKSGLQRRRAAHRTFAAAEWDRLFTAGDLAGLTALYAPAVISMPYDTPTLQGRENQQSAFQQFFAENNAARHETTVDQVISTDDWAIERSRYKMTYTPKSTGKEVVETGRHIMCRKKVDGKWLIAWEIWNTDHAMR